MTTQAELDRLKKARSSPAQTIEKDGERVTFRPIDELSKAIQITDEEVNGSTRTQLRRTRIHTASGW
jgi:hypothetical protein